MVVDKFENLEKYASLNPLFAEAIKFLKTTDHCNTADHPKAYLETSSILYFHCCSARFHCTSRKFLRCCQIAQIGTIRLWLSRAES